MRVIISTTLTYVSEWRPQTPIFIPEFRRCENKEFSGFFISWKLKPVPSLAEERGAVCGSGRAPRLHTSKYIPAVGRTARDGSRPDYAGRVVVISSGKIRFLPSAHFRCTDRFLSPGASLPHEPTGGGFRVGRTAGNLNSGV